MNLNKIKYLPYYNKSFKKLILEEFEQFKSERSINGVNLLKDSLNATNKELIEQFRIYFYLRYNSRIEDIMTECKDEVYSDKNITPERLTNALDGFKKQIEIWVNKIQGENHELKKHDSKSLKLFCYEVFFEYCNKLKDFHNEYLQFLKQNFKDFDFNQKYFANLNYENDNSNSIKSPLMTKTEVAEYLKISVRQVTNLEKLEHFKRNNHVGNSPRYLRSEIEKYANTRRY